MKAAPPKGYLPTIPEPNPLPALRLLIRLPLRRPPLPHRPPRNPHKMQPASGTTPARKVAPEARVLQLHAPNAAPCSLTTRPTTAPPVRRALRAKPQPCRIRKSHPNPHKMQPASGTTRVQAVAPAERVLPFRVRNAVKRWRTTAPTISSKQVPFQSSPIAFSDTR